MKKTVQVRMDDGLGASPIAMMVQTANCFSSEIYLEVQEKHVNAKSIMGMMSLVLTNGTAVTVEASGPDEEEAVLAMEGFLTGKQ